MANTPEPIDTEKLALLKQMVENADKNVKAAKQLLSQLLPTGTIIKPRKAYDEEDLENANIVEGTFDGESMIGTDGKVYPIPANYASKSKLVEGDTLKLSILPDGSFVFKQIGPVERIKILGTLMQNDAGEFSVLANGQSYKVLTASVTYYKGQPGDQSTIVIPKNGSSEWGAIENIIRDITNVATDSGTSISDITQENSPDIQAIDEELKAGKDLL